MNRSLPSFASPDYEEDLDFDLLKSQRNELFSIAHGAGFSGDEFKWWSSDGAFFGIEGERVPMIQHIPTRSYCKFGFRDEGDFRRTPRSSAQRFDGEFFLQRSPGEVKDRDALLWASWDLVKAGFAEWLGFVRRESTQLDFWTITPPAGLLPPVGEAIPNASFSVDERNHIAASLDEVREEVKRLGILTEEQGSDLEVTLKEVRAAAARLGRRDWANTVIGAYAGWAMNQVLTSSAAQAIFDLLVTKLSWIWTELPKLLH